jgi:hypothetical protein
MHQSLLVVFFSCRAVADADEDEADGQEEEPAAQADSLQRPEAAPFPHPDAVYDADPEQDQASDSGKEDAQLSFRYHIGGNKFVITYHEGHKVLTKDTKG